MIYWLVLIFYAVSCITSDGLDNAIMLFDLCNIMQFIAQYNTMLFNETLLDSVNNANKMCFTR